MNRRNFFGVVGGALAAVSLTPSGLFADDYRKLKPKAWTAHKVDAAVKALYGDVKLIESDKVKIKVPKVNSNGGAVPVKFGTKIPAKTIALFQDANPEAAVAVYTVTKYDITDYEVRIKMAENGTVSVVVEGQDGKFYTAKQATEVAAGGCEG